MRNRAHKLVAAVVVLTTAACLAAASPAAKQPRTSSAAGAARDITDDEIAVTMDLLMASKNYDALEYLDSLESDCAGEPLYLLTRARVLQNFIRPLSDDTDGAKEQARPAIDILEQVVDICSKRMETGDDNPDLSLYRGWAWMLKAHMRALGRSFYTAGRDAGRGKKDLEEYLEMYPDHPTANGLLGAYLYFADAIPNVFKFLSKLLFLPSGDRVRGLEMMRRAVEGKHPFMIDYVLVRNFVSFYFEGRIEEGLTGTEEVMDRYPFYVRTGMLLAMGSPLAPTRYADYNARIKRMIAGLNAGDARNIDWDFLYTALVFRAYADRFLSNPKLADARFRSIIHESPSQPDWAGGFARFQLAQICAADGRLGEARTLLQSVLDIERNDRFRDKSKEMLDELDELGVDAVDPTVLPDGLWIEAVYRSGADSLETLAARFENLATESPIAAFYAGECRMLLGQYGASRAWYRRLIDWDLPAWFDAYRMLACTRAAEVYAVDGDYEQATDLQERAMDFYQNEYGFDWILDGRRQFFERLAEGQDVLPSPSLLPAAVGSANR